MFGEFQNTASSRSLAPPPPEGENFQFDCSLSLCNLTVLCDAILNLSHQLEHENITYFCPCKSSIKVKMDAHVIPKSTIYRNGGRVPYFGYLL